MAQIPLSSPDEGVLYSVSPLPNVCLALITPDSSEIRWVFAVPERGARIHGRWPGTWFVVNEVVQSGVTTYTVFASAAPKGVLDQARNDLVDTLERLQESVSPRTQRNFGPRQLRHYLS